MTRTLELSLESISIEQIRIEFVLRVLRLVELPDFHRNNFGFQKIVVRLLHNLVRSRSDTFIWKKLLAHVERTLFSRERSGNFISFDIDSDKLSNFFILEKKLLQNANFRQLRAHIIRQALADCPVATTPATEGTDIKVTRIDNALNLSCTSAEEDAQVLQVLESMTSFQVLDSLVIRFVKFKGER